MPPKGVGRWRTFSELIQIMPASRSRGDAVGAAHVAGPDVAGQAVAHVVGDAQRLGLVLERQTVSTGPKISSWAMRMRAVGVEIERRLHVVALAAHRPSAAAGERGALLRGQTARSPAPCPHDAGWISGPISVAGSSGCADADALHPLGERLP